MFGSESAESCAKDSGGVKVDMELTVFGLRDSPSAHVFSRASLEESVL